MRPLALPRKAHHSVEFNGLAGNLGKNPPIELQSVSTAHPKPSHPTFPIRHCRMGAQLLEVVRVALDQYNGRHTINGRVWYHDDDDVLKPGKTGITLALKHLPALADAMGKHWRLPATLGLIEARRRRLIDFHDMK